MKKLLLAFVVSALLGGCGDKVCDVPTGANGQTHISVRLGCSNGITVYSIEGSCYVKGAGKEKSTDAINGKGATFVVVPNTKYIVRANNGVRTGNLLGSMEVVAPGPGEDTTVTITCK